MILCMSNTGEYSPILQKMQMEHSQTANELQKYQLSSAKREDATKEAFLRDIRASNGDTAALEKAFMNAGRAAEWEKIKHDRMATDKLKQDIHKSKLEAVKEFSSLVTANPTDEALAMLSKRYVDSGMFSMQEATKALKEYAPLSLPERRERLAMGAAKADAILSAIAPKVAHVATPTGGVNFYQENARAPGFGQTPAGMFNLQPGRTPAQIDESNRGWTNIGLRGTEVGSNVARLGYETGLAPAPGFGGGPPRMPVQGNALVPTVAPITNALATPAAMPRAAAVAPVAAPTTALGGVPPKLMNEAKVKQLEGQAAALTKAFEDDAPKFVSSINAINTAKSALEGGAYTGKFAEFTMQSVKALAENLPSSVVPAGFEKKIANTETYQGATGQLVMNIIKTLGSGTAISDADREYAAKVVAGEISLNKESLTRLLDSAERAVRENATRHNSKVEQASKAGFSGMYDMSIKLPEPYKGGRAAGQMTMAAPTAVAPADKQALDWANANPKDPRAAQIKARLGQ